MSEADFEQVVAPFRPELLAHCYRMTGALSDAEDALQNAFVRAWRAYDRFEGRSSLRTWLYRIATNACLDVIGERRGRTLPEHAGPPGRFEPGEDEPTWIEPFPDERLPDRAMETRRAVRLAFIVALQVLPARQRAALILRDVVGLSAEETAETLDMTVAAANSALQRARATIEERVPTTNPEPAKLRDVLARYVAAWESGDAQGLIALLRHDAILAMPPTPLWIRGADAVAEFLRTAIFVRGPLRLVESGANGAPAFAVYAGDTYLALSVLDIGDDGIAAIHSFVAK